MSSGLAFSTLSVPHLSGVEIVMGYFSNGAEGMDYESRYCDHCVHQDGPDGKSGCAVWQAHVFYNYTECNNKESILHLLIPRGKGGWNEQCQMFAKKGGGE